MMRTEDLGAFTDLLKGVALTCRMKEPLTAERTAAYFTALQDKSLAWCRKRLQDLQATSSWFPSVAKIRGEDEDAPPKSPPRYSDEWWQGVRRNEEAIRASEEEAARRHRGSAAVTDFELAQADASVASAARGTALHDDGSESARMWARRYQRAVLFRDALRLQRAAQIISDPLSDPDQEAARAARHAQLRNEAALLLATLDSLAPIDDPADAVLKHH